MGEQVRMGGESTKNTYEEGREWTLDDPVMKRAERTRDVLKGLEYTLKKRVFTMLPIRYFLYPKPQIILDLEVVYVQCKRLGGIQGRGGRAHHDEGGRIPETFSGGLDC
jgi:hypothetical protein